MNRHPNVLAPDSNGRTLRRPRTAPAIVYLALSGPDLIDTAGEGELKEFVERLCSDWPELDNEDLAVWVTTRLGKQPRLVALLRPGASGRTVTFWM